MILRAERTLECQAFNQLYVHAYNLVLRAGGSRKTVVLGERIQENGTLVRENYQIPEGHLEALSKEGWVVLDILSFQPQIEDLLAKQKMTRYPNPYLHDFSIPLITSGIFATVHFAENFSESFDALQEHAAARSYEVPIAYLM